MTYFDGGDGVQVYNSLFYPSYQYDLPLLGIDLISLGRKRVLAVVDFQPLHPNEEYSNLASSINQSVGRNRVKTLIQPVIQNQITQVPTPVPIAQPVGGNVTRMKRSELPNNIAKLIQ